MSKDLLLNGSLIDSIIIFKLESIKYTCRKHLIESLNILSDDEKNEFKNIFFKYDKHNNYDKYFVDKSRINNFFDKIKKKYIYTAELHLLSLESFSEILSENILLNEIKNSIEILNLEKSTLKIKNINDISNFIADEIFNVEVLDIYFTINNKSNDKDKVDDLLRILYFRNTFTKKLKFNINLEFDIENKMNVKLNPDFAECKDNQSNEEFKNNINDINIDYVFTKINLTLKLLFLFIIEYSHTLEYLQIIIKINEMYISSFENFYFEINNEVSDILYILLQYDKLKKISFINFSLSSFNERLRKQIQLSIKLESFIIEYDQISKESKDTSTLNIYKFNKEKMIASNNEDALLFFNMIKFGNNHISYLKILDNINKK